MSLKLVRDSISDVMIDDQRIVSPEHDGLAKVFFLVSLVRVHGVTGKRRCSRRIGSEEKLTLVHGHLHGGKEDLGQ